MNGLALISFGVVLVALVSIAWWRRSRRQRWPLASRDVRCPFHECQAEVTVRTNPDARPRRQHVEVVACSLLSDAVGLPERRAYLPDSPPAEVVLEPARRYPVHTSGISCRQPCVFALDASAATVTPQPLRCASGTSDALDLMRQADRRAAGRPSLWYGSSL
jgi:hypothetical protein